MAADPSLQHNPQELPPAGSALNFPVGSSPQPVDQETRPARQDLVEARISQLVAIFDHAKYKDWRPVRIGFLRQVAEQSVEARMESAAWEALISTLSRVERPFYRYTAHLATGFISLTELTRPPGDEPPLTAHEWQKVSDMLVLLDQERDRPKNKFLKKMPEMLMRIARLNPPEELLSSYSRIAARAITQGRSVITVERDLQVLTENLHFLHPSEYETVTNRLLRRCSDLWDFKTPLSSTWDIAFSQIERLAQVRINPRPALETLGRARITATQTKREGPGPNVLEAFSEILESSAAHCVNLQDLSGQAQAAAVYLLADLRSSRVSLEIINDEILPYYRRKGWPVTAVLQNFAPAGDAPPLLRFQEYIVGSAIQAGIPVEPFIGRELLNICTDPDQTQIVAMYQKCASSPEIANHPVLKDPLALNRLGPDLLEIVTRGLQRKFDTAAITTFAKNYLDIANLAVRQIGSENAVEDPVKNLRRCMRDLFALECDAGVFSQIAHLVRTEPDYALQDAMGHVFDTVTHIAYFQKMRGPDVEVENVAARVLASDYNQDTLPFVTVGKMDPRALTMHEEVQHFTWRLVQPAKGFSAWTAEARKIPGADHCALVEFGLDLAQEVGYLNSSGIEVFPGNGFYLHGLKIESALVADKAHSDPYHLYRDAWWFAQNLEDWRDTRYLMARGFIAITGPNNSRFKLPAPRIGSSTNETFEEHYTTIIFNDHFHNPACHVACAVPTRIFDRILKGTHVPADQYDGFDPQRPDITKLEITYEDLQRICHESGANFIDLGWPSNIAGLCNAYPPKSAPFHQWESAVNSRIMDRAGHLHKTTVLGGYSADLSPAHDRALQPLRDLHTRVLNFGNACLDCLDGLIMLEALHQKGQTLARPDSLGQILDLPELGTESGRSAQERFLEQRENPPDSEEAPALGPYSARRLAEIYRWHRASEEPGVPLSRIPIFRVGDAMRLWPGGFMLEIDPATLILKTPHFKIQLPFEGDGSGEEELALWREYVMPYAEGPYAFRFWGRSSR
ncbi:MAG: hypothetical protein J0M12_13625 [Deltaproteobacteria bacterium]|nr:hypothetical protein [Deltaproteobacteria bacterium]